jgi:sugar phosphate isomerase/epimerase
MTRRRCRTGALVAFVCMAFFGSAAAQMPFGWRVGPAAWSFNRFSFFEAIDKTASIGMGYIEAFEGQRVMPGAETKFDWALPDEVIAQIRAKLDRSKVKLTSFYINDIPGDEAACRRVFDFARKLGVEFIVSEPLPEALDTIERCCNEYGIDLAIHNHPNGSSRYWNPEEVARVCQGRGPRVGACGDTGHWLRSGIKPADAFRVLGKRIIAVHLKDLDAAAPDAHDMPWGQGCGDLELALRTLRELRIAPRLFAVEYESEMDNNLPRIDECGKWFVQTVNMLAAEANREDPLFAGWASIDITPPEPVALVGQLHKRISTGVLDPLTATVLALETRAPNGANEQAVLVSCDLGSVEKRTTDSLREAVKAQLPDLDTS